MLCLFSACSKAPEEEKLVFLTEEESASAYEMVYAQTRDVILTKAIPCNYRQTHEQEVSFDVGGKRIDKVYVHAGDKVKAGDILAELAVGNIAEDIAKLEYDMEVIKHKESYLDAWQDFELEESYFGLVYRSGMEEEDVKAKDERDADIKQSYDYRRQDFEDELEFDEQKLNKMKRELSESKLTAKMSGTVLKIEDNLEGSTSKKGEVIMTIIDGTDGMFVCEAMEYADVLKNTTNLNLYVVYGDAKGDYIVTPYNVQNWNEEQCFIVLEGPENDGIEVGTTANLIVTLETKENVLSLPKGSVYEADGKKYVYVLDDKGMKTIKWVEAGLEGDEYIEITSGLVDGEAVVRR